MDFQELYTRWSSSVYGNGKSVTSFRNWLDGLYDMMANDYVAFEHLSAATTSEYIGDIFTVDEIKYLLLEEA